MDSIPPIICVEPVYPSIDSEKSFWVYCDAHWDDEQHIFINRDASADWILDDHAFPDSVYLVGDTEYNSMDDAMRAALGDALFEKHNPAIFAMPAEGHSPEWGPEA